MATGPVVRVSVKRVWTAVGAVVSSSTKWRMGAPRAPAILSRVVTVGTMSPRSTLCTEAVETSAALASCCRVMPRSRRSTRTLGPIEPTTLSHADGASTTTA